MKKFIGKPHKKIQKPDSSYEINKTGKALLPEHRLICNPKIILPVLGACSLFFFFLCNYLFQTIVQIIKINEISTNFNMGMGNAFRFSGRYWLFYVFLILLIFLFDTIILYRVKTNFKDLNINQKGSERFATLKEIKEQYKAIPERGFSYPGKPGVPVCRYQDKIYIDDSPVNNLIIGMTRSGKGETFVFPTIDIYSRAQQKASLVVIDPKLGATRS